MTLNDYVSWTATLWMSKADAQGVADLAVMSLGLCGESAELALACTAELSDPRKRELALKEAGDVLYYWSMLVHTHQLDALAVWEFSEEVPTGQPLSAALLLSTGSVAELMKKAIRDQRDVRLELHKALASVAGALRYALLALGASWEEVARVNQAKLCDRQARGVLSGSGDER